MAPANGGAIPSSESPALDTGPTDPWQAYDQMPLSPELEAVMEREQREDQYEVSQRDASPYKPN